MFQNMAGNFGAILRDDIAMDLAVAKLQRNRSVGNLQRIDNKITIVAIVGIEIPREHSGSAYKLHKEKKSE